LVLLCLLAFAFCYEKNDIELVKQYYKQSNSILSDRDAESILHNLELNFETWSYDNVCPDGQVGCNTPVLAPFNCTTFAPQNPPPTTISCLTIADINVVMAIGDDITTAFGAKAKSFKTLFTDYRGVSWSGGGDDNIKYVETFPNLIKAYNPKVIGYAQGAGGAFSDNARFNQAKDGARASDLLAQAMALKQRLLKDKKVDFNNDWKVLTILIGGTNLCTLCFDYSGNSVANITLQVEATLDWIAANIPRVFVNLVPMIDITLVNQLNTSLCKALHIFQCPCGSSLDSKIRANVSATAQQLFNSLVALSFCAKYTGPDNFTVVVQPFLKNTQIPTLTNGNPDFSYFAPDCFHLSTKGQQALAIGLFNNIYQNLDRKSVSFTVGEQLSCPSQFEVLGTRQNSLLQSIYKK